MTQCEKITQTAELNLNLSLQVPPSHDKMKLKYLQTTTEHI
jgi:hypothetical protein